MIGDRYGDRLKEQPITHQTAMDKAIQKIGDRLIEKLMFFVRRGAE